jgi:phosphotransferase system HPr (HPr) family protein
VLERNVTIVNRLGLHARAAAKFVNVAKAFTSTIRIGIGDRRVDGKSIMSVMLLAASQGTQVIVSADGTDEIEALEAIAALIADRFGENE